MTGEKTLNSAFDGPSALARRLCVYYTRDSRHNDDGYDCNCANSPSARVGIAISWLTAPQTRPIADATLDMGPIREPDCGLARCWPLQVHTMLEVGPNRGPAGLLALNIAERNRRYRTLRTLQLTKQIIQSTSTYISSGVRVSGSLHWLSRAFRDAFCERRLSMINTGIPQSASASSSGRYGASVSTIATIVCRISFRW